MHKTRFIFFQILQHGVPWMNKLFNSFLKCGGNFIYHNNHCEWVQRS